MKNDTFSMTRFFETKGAAYLLESIYVNSYKDLGCCSIKKHNTISIFFSNLEKENTSSVFFNMIKEKERFQLYTDKFQEFLSSADEKCCLYAKNGSSNKLVRLFLVFLSLYRYTESFYTDYTYQICSSMETIKERLIKLEQLKTSGRNFLNSFFNGRNSYISIASNFTKDPLILMYSSVDEVLKNIQPSKEQIAVRIADHLLTYNDVLYSSDSIEFKKSSNHFTIISTNNTGVITGIVASQGKVQATAYVLNADFTNYDLLEKTISEMPSNVILVTETTSPDLIQACHKAIGIVTNQGGLGSHAAIISRELGIPCVVATQNATQKIISGDIVEIDGSKGEVRIIERGI